MSFVESPIRSRECMTLYFFFSQMISFFFSGSCLSSLEKSLSSLYKISFGMPPPYAIHLGRPCNHCEVKRNLKYSEFAFAQFWKLQRSLTPFNLLSFSDAESRSPSRSGGERLVSYLPSCQEPQYDSQSQTPSSTSTV
jgi:hypothetical protein